MRDELVPKLEVDDAGSAHVLHSPVLAVYHAHGNATVQARQGTMPGLLLVSLHHHVRITMCNIERTSRPSPMMWPCMDTKGWDA